MEECTSTVLYAKRFIYGKMTDRSGLCKTLGRGGPGFAIFPIFIHTVRYKEKKKKPA